MVQRSIEISMEDETGQVMNWVEGTSIVAVYGYWVELVQGGYVMCGAVVQQDVQTQRVIGHVFPPGVMTQPHPRKGHVIRSMQHFIRQKARELVKLYQGKGEQIVSCTVRC